MTQGWPGQAVPLSPPCSSWWDIPDLSVGQDAHGPPGTAYTADAPSPTSHLDSDTSQPHNPPMARWAQGSSCPYNPAVRGTPLSTAPQCHHPHPAPPNPVPPSQAGVCQGLPVYCQMSGRLGLHQTNATEAVSERGATGRGGRAGGAAGHRDGGRGGAVLLTSPPPTTLSPRPTPPSQRWGPPWPPRPRVPERFPPPPAPCIEAGAVRRGGPRRGAAWVGGGAGIIAMAGGSSATLPTLRSQSRRASSSPWGAPGPAAWLRPRASGTPGGGGPRSVWSAAASAAGTWGQRWGWGTEHGPWVGMGSGLGWGEDGNRDGVWMGIG